MESKPPPEDPLGTDKAEPIGELKDFSLEEDPEFPHRVKRSLNRQVLVGDSLEFSLDMLQKTLWEYVKTMFESWPPAKGRKPE